MMLLRLAFRNLRRNLRRSLLTASTVLLGTTLVTLALAWVEGVMSGMIELYAAQSGLIRVVNAEYAAREALMPLYANLPDVAALQKAAKGVPGVADAEPRIVTGAVITAGDEIGDTFCQVVAASDAFYTGRLHAADLVVDGTWLTGGPKEVVLGRSLARDLKAAVGADVLLLGQTQYGAMSPVSARVVGIVASDALINQQAFLPLVEGQWMLDLEGGAIELLVWPALAADWEVSRVASALETLPEMQGTSVTAWFEREPWNSMIPMLDAMKFVIQAIILFITALAIFNTMTMSVMERTQEVGVLRAMGMGRLKAVSMFVIEATCIGVLGGLGGVLLGGLGGLYLERHGMTFGEELTDKLGSTLPFKSTFYADMNPSVAASALVLALAIAFVGAFLPSLRAAAIQPVVAMRSRR